MAKEQLYDAMGEIPDKMVDDCRIFAEKQRRASRMKRWIRIGSVAACFCLTVCAVIGLLVNHRRTEDGKIAADCLVRYTDGFSQLFFGITSPGESGVQAGIWANPVTPGSFRTSVTLGQALADAAEETRFAVLVRYAVRGEDGGENSQKDLADLDRAFEFFREQGLEAGVLGDNLYLAATKAELLHFCDGKTFAGAAVGAEFCLANPTAAQQAAESSIRY